MSLLPAVGEHLEHQDILFHPHYTCCVSCGSRQAADEAMDADMDGFAFFTAQDTDLGLENGHLHLAFGGVAIADEDVGCVVQRALQVMGYMTSWNGDEDTRICIHLEEPDIQYLQEFVDADLEEFYADEIAEFRLRRAWQGFQKGVEESMGQKSELGDAFEAWTLLPGGPAFKRAKTSFET